MFSFLILIAFHLVPCVFNLLADFIQGKTQNAWKWIGAIILLFIAIYLKSINL